MADRGRRRLLNFDFTQVSIGQTCSASSSAFHSADEVVGRLLAFFGLANAGVLKHAFSLPFPFNLLLLPVFGLAASGQACTFNLPFPSPVRAGLLR